MRKESTKKYDHWIYLLLFGLFWLFFLTDTGNAIDCRMSLSIYNALDSEIVTNFFIFVTKYTFGSFIGICILFAYQAYKKDRQAVLITSLLFILMSIFYIGLNSYSGRLRPFAQFDYVDQLVTSDWMWEYSFPSGHSTFAFFIAYFLTNRYKFSAATSLIIYSIAILVAISRVYLGMHYFFDVTAGAFLGLFFGVVGVKLLSKKSGME